MGCAASKLDIEADRSILSGLRPINIKKYRRQRLRRYNTFSTTTDLIQSEGSETPGDTSPSGKVKASAVAPEPIAEEETENSERENLSVRDGFEMKKVPEDGPKENMEREVPKEITEERKQKSEEMTMNREQPVEEPGEEIEVKSQRKKEDPAKDREEPAKYREEPKEEKEESIQCRTLELMKNKQANQQRTEILKVKDEEVISQHIATQERTKSNEEVERKNKEPMEKVEAGYGPNLISKRTAELEEVFPGSPSFRFYCRNMQSFDSDDSATASGLQSTERLEEIKQHNEPIEEVSESQASASASASSQDSQCYSPRKRRGRRHLKLKTPNAVRSLFTCYSASNGCGNGSPGSSRYKNHLIRKRQ